MVALWGLGVLFLLPLVAATIGLFVEGRKPDKAAHLLGALLTGLVWLAAVAYCGYRAVLAVP